MVPRLHLNAEEQKSFAIRKARVTTNALFLLNYNFNALLQKTGLHF